MRLLNLYFTKSHSNFFCRTPGKEFCSSRKLSDFYTLSQIKLSENHTLNSSTYLYSLYIGVPPPPGGKSALSFEYGYFDLCLGWDSRVLGVGILVVKICIKRLSEINLDVA